MVDSILTGISGLLSPSVIVIIIIGLLVGMVFGSLPGFSATMGVAVCIPFSYWLSPELALLLLSGVYCGAIYGGSITAVLLGIPGTPASLPTTFDGVPLARKGQAGRALAIVTYAASVGGFLSSIALLIGAPLLAIVALKIGPPEQMMLAIFGLSVVCMMSTKSLLKGLLVATLSLLIATVGQDPIEGYPRFTFDFYQLIGGIPFLPILIGVFSLPEVFKMIEERVTKKSLSSEMGSMKVTIKEKWRLFRGTVRAALIGIGIGIIPAAGPEIASFVAYNEAKRSSKKPEKFGQGSEEGLVAPEAASNGVTGGSLIPLLTLGIPGSAPAALFLGALYIHGLRPGPTLFAQNTDIVYTVLVGFAVINILMYFMGMLYCRISAKVVKVPISVLVPLIMTLSILGAYASQRSMLDVGIMLVAGIIGYFMLKYDYPVAPIALALILGPMLEESLQQTLIMTQGNLLSILLRPVTVLFLLLALVSLFWPFITKLSKQLKKS